MLKTLSLKDIDMIISFYKIIGVYSDELIKNIETNIETSKIICADIDQDKITSLLTVNLINNQYYLEDVLTSNEDIERIKDLLSYSIEVIRSDERGLNIIYDNFPYREIMDKIMIESGFKCNFLNYSREYDGVITNVLSNININDKETDVKEYLYEKYVQVIKDEDEYLGKESKKLPTIDEIHLDNVNIAVVRDTSRKVIGVARFSLITDYIFINSLYAESDEVYIDLINLISNLTNRKLEIGVYPVRKDLMRVLESVGFIRTHSDYVIKLN